MSEKNTQNTVSQKEILSEWEIDNLPNRLTIFRVALIPVICLTLYLCLFEENIFKATVKTLGYIAAWTFVLASITDFFDGYIARRRNIVTVFGSFLDPIADKFLVVSSLILLQALDRVNVIVVIVLVLREMYMTALRLLAMEKGLKVSVNQLGKWKTTFQMMAIPMLMAWDKPFGFSFPLVGTILIYLSFVFSVFSALVYTFGLFKKISEVRKERKQK
ncbi:CDP-diacylglycerol--glycerol-3-phosphate 3-phosphatidyltransferase [Bacteriovorax sp. BAL6_X]|uniref:CDP-diacylglycerol--glycerol-3-phosphate 3-phosphatidyltransferase n=1 Tax=Bacteriovorax sp. BAL6_X TaxID=1201290 RepID=UPI0003861D1E|nr:CDP-diacylglycerol--glycerol-3-phosphate 3-phosphatidyltransferase [Bacteriovorax sp. BAL6_X]EPZ50653.1 CDP-diacylglycerol--glycerol-3-phosphate 3-phosphatidyltransferase [Bacteriovorax sp. BAL6_X]